MAQKVLKDQLIGIYANLVDHYASVSRPEVREAYLAPLKGLKKGSKILIPGAGTGVDAEILLNSGHEVTCVDLSPHMCACAEERFASKHSVKVINIDMVDFEIANNEYDAVLSSMEIFHHADLKKLLSVYSKSLKVGGSLVLVTNHPIRNYLCHLPESYFYESLRIEHWGNGISMPKHHWKLSTYIKSILQSGLTLVDLIEHEPTNDVSAIQDSKVNTFENYPSIITYVCQK